MRAMILNKPASYAVIHEDYAYFIPLNQANEALIKLKSDAIEGSAVLQINP